MMDSSVKIARIAFASLLFCMGGCGGPSPDDVARDCVDYLEDADFAKMAELATGQLKTRIDQAVEKYSEVALTLGAKESKKLQKTYGKLKYKIGETKVNGSRAVVHIMINGQDTPMNFVKVDGDWRIESFTFPIL